MAVEIQKHVIEAKTDEEKIKSAAFTKDLDGVITHLISCGDLKEIPSPFVMLQAQWKGVPVTIVVGEYADAVPDMVHDLLRIRETLGAIEKEVKNDSTAKH